MQRLEACPAGEDARFIDLLARMLQMDPGRLIRFCFAFLYCDILTCPTCFE